MEPLSIDLRSSLTPVKPTIQLIKLDIKTMSDGISIWLQVSRSAPLGEMLVTALQTDDALRGYVFMLPGQFNHWDDTPDKVRYKDHIQRETKLTQSTAQP